MEERSGYGVGFHRRLDCQPEPGGGAVVVGPVIELGEISRQAHIL